MTLALRLQLAKGRSRRPKCWCHISSGLGPGSLTQRGTVTYVCPKKACNVCTVCSVVVVSSIQRRSCVEATLPLPPWSTGLLLLYWGLLSKSK